MYELKKLQMGWKEIECTSMGCMLYARKVVVFVCNKLCAIQKKKCICSELNMLNVGGV